MVLQEKNRSLMILLWSASLIWVQGERIPDLYVACTNANLRLNIISGKRVFLLPDHALPGTQQEFRIQQLVIRAFFI